MGEHVARYILCEYCGFEDIDSLLGLSFFYDELSARASFLKTLKEYKKMHFDVCGFEEDLMLAEIKAQEAADDDVFWLTCIPVETIDEWPTIAKRVATSYPEILVSWREAGITAADEIIRSYYGDGK